MEAPISVTKTIYTVTDFVAWQREGHLNLRPYFQRGNVWTPKAKSFLIDTLLRGYSIPIIYLQNKPDRHTLTNVRLVVDGQQRLRTILSYVAPTILTDYSDRDSFSILRSHNAEYAGLPFDALPSIAQDRILQTELSVHVLPPSLSDAHLLQLFARLNSTGERLNDQELRNAEFHGVFKTLAYNLSYEQLERWLEWSIFPARSIAQMRDVELMSELMIGTLRGAQNKSKKQIDDIYRFYDDDFAKSDEVVSRVRDTFNALEEIYRHVAPIKAANLNTQSWLYAIYLAADIALHGRPISEPGTTKGIRDVQRLAENRTVKQLTQDVQRVQSLLEADNVSRDLARALRGASSDLGSRLARLKFLLER
jgi:hypothetical protein